jgi:hypothetical protein
MSDYEAHRSFPSFEGFLIHLQFEMILDNISRVKINKIPIPEDIYRKVDRTFEVAIFVPLSAP